MMAKEIVAMILAGGKGTRLEALTKKVAKPAVYYGGRYRIIDFPLSNCANSHIDTVGVLTQYESVALNNYLGNGEKWGLNGVRSLTSIMPPRQTESGANWYKGTADAIAQNIDFLDSIKPQYVLILSGDHIYKMNYRKMLRYHISNKADATIAVINVTLKEATRFGIMNVNDDLSIYEFEEKPANPKSTLASMGIYIFTYSVLREALIKDMKNDESEHDFGKNIIPYLIKKNKKAFAYKFEGYWKDVGTLDSLWQANMDLLDDKDDVDLYSKNSETKIFSEDTKSVPQYIGKEASVVNSILNQGAIVLGHVSHSVISNEVLIEEGAEVYDSVVMPGAIIRRGAKIRKAIIGDNVEIKENEIINKDAENVVLIKY